MILIDSNIPMYLVGESLTFKAEAQRLLEKYILQRERLVTDAEVLQEILHRYAAIHRLDAIQPAFDALLGVVDEIFPVDAAVVQRAKTILLGKKRISARGALHVGVMEQQQISHILSFDSGFDGIPGIVRLKD
jgi:hypothetical protein